MIKFDEKIAFKLLEKFGVLQRPAAGSVSPQKVRQQIKVELARQRLRSRKRRAKIRQQIVAQKAHEAEAKNQPAPLENLSTVEPIDVIFDDDAVRVLDRLAAELREARKGDPNFNFNENYVVTAVDADPSEAKAVMAELERRVGKAGAVNDHNVDAK